MAMNKLPFHKQNGVWQPTVSNVVGTGLVVNAPLESFYTVNGNLVTCHVLFDDIDAPTGGEASFDLSVPINPRNSFGAVNDAIGVFAMKVSGNVPIAGSIAAVVATDTVQVEFAIIVGANNNQAAAQFCYKTE